jgi:hypothetical protein
VCIALTDQRAVEAQLFEFSLSTSQRSVRNLTRLALAGHLTYLNPCPPSYPKLPSFQLPYILESNPHPNLIRTQFLATS